MWLAAEGRLPRRALLAGLAEHFRVPLVEPDLAMAAPGNQRILDDLSQRFGAPVAAAIADSEAMERVLARIERGDHEDAPDIPLILDRLLRAAIRDRASDVHIECMKDRVRVRFRLDGSLVDRTDLPSSLRSSLVSRAKLLCQADVAPRWSCASRST